MENIRNGRIELFGDAVHDIWSFHRKLDALAQELIALDMSGDTYGDENIREFLVEGASVFASGNVWERCVVRGTGGSGSAQFAYRIREGGGIGGFEHEVVRAERERFVDEEFAFEVGEDNEDGAFFEFGEVDVGQHAEAVQEGHDEVEDNGVREKSFGFGDGVQTVFGGGEDVEVGERGERLGEGIADGGIVVGDEKFESMHKSLLY